MSRRTVAWTLSVAGVAIALLLTVAWALLSTEWGTRRVWDFVSARLPEGLTVESVAGPVRGPLALQGLVFRGEGAGVRVGRISVEWSLRSLLRRTLSVRSLEVDDITVELRPAETPAQDTPAPPPLPTLSLPLAVQVERAVVRRVRVVPAAADARPLVLDSVRLRRLAFDNRLEVGALEASGPDGAFGARGWLVPRGEYPLSVEVQGQALVPQLAPLNGRVSLSGSLELLVVGAGVTAPFVAELSATVESPRSGPTFEAELVLEELDAPSVGADWPALRAHATVTASGSPDSIRADATGLIETPQTGSVSVEGVMHYAGSTLLVERLAATVRDARVATRGTVVFGGAEPVMDLTVDGAALRWPLYAPPRIRVDTTWAHVQGTPSAYRVVGGGAGSQVDGPSGRVRLTGSGTREGFELTDVRVAALDGTLRARGSVAWAPVPRWNLTASIENVDPSTLVRTSSPLDGRISMRGRTRGRVAAGETRATVTVEEIRGTLRGQAVTGTGTGSFLLPAPAQGTGRPIPHVSLDTLVAEWGPNTLTAAGTGGADLDLRVRLEAPDLGLILTGAEGRVDVRAAVWGTRAAPSVEATLLAQGLGYQDNGVEDVSLDVDIDSRSEGEVDVHGIATGLVLGTAIVDSLTVDATGTPQSHDVTGRLIGSGGALDLRAVGGVHESTWSGIVRGFDVGTEALGAWALADSVRVELAMGRGTVERGCWSSEAATACASGSWEAEGSTNVDASVRELEMQRFDSWLPEGWTATGVLGAEADVQIDADGALVLDARADLGSGRITYPSARGIRALDFSDVVAGAVADDDGSRAWVGLLLSSEEAPTVATLQGTLELPGYTHLNQAMPTQPVRGRMEASVTDLSALDAMVPRVEDLAGELNIDVTVAGTVEEPELRGDARLRGGRADLPRWGLEMRDVEWTATGLGREGVALEGQMRSGTGEVRVSGTIPARPTPARPATLSISGERFLALEIPEASVWISPALDITASSERVDVTGRVDVPRARVELREIAPTGVAPSRDVVFVGDSAATTPVGPEIHTNVRITLGDSVSFRGFGLSADPRGSIVATDAPGRATTAAGEITLTNGRYRAYGQELTMDRGRIIYAGGPLDNPGLDVRASRRASDGVVAGLEVRGTVRYPEVTLFSDPTLTQSEVLAYIVIGRPLGTASTSEGSRVAGAAATLGIKGGNVLAGRIAQRFGLDEVRIEAEGPLRGASLVAGAYLSPRLYVSYGVGLFEPINTFRMRYTLSRLWTLQAETGRATGADFMYRILRGR